MKLMEMTEGLGGLKLWRKALVVNTAQLPTYETSYYQCLTAQTYTTDQNKHLFLCSARGLSQRLSKTRPRTVKYSSPQI